MRSGRHQSLTGTRPNRRSARSRGAPTCRSVQVMWVLERCVARDFGRGGEPNRAVTGRGNGARLEDMAADGAGLVYAQALETFRSFTAHALQSITVLLVAYTTVVGFALERHSWGLMAISSVLILAMWAALLRYTEAAALVLDVAKACEPAVISPDNEERSGASMAVSLAYVLAVQLPTHRSWRGRWMLVVLIVATLAHVFATIWLATAQGWPVIARS